MPSSMEEKASRLGEYVDLLPPAAEGAIVVSSRTSSKSGGTERPLLADCSEESSDWRAIYTVSGISFLTFIVIYTLNIESFVYLTKITSDANVYHQGWQRFYIRLFHGIATALFAVIAYNSKKFRFSVLSGNGMLILGSVLYTLIEVVPDSLQTFSWLLVFALHSSAEGANTVLNAYIPRVSTKADRMQAYSYLAGAEVVAVFFAPLIVIACHLVEGEHEVFGISWLKASEFTIPIWLSLFIALANHALIYFTMEEPREDKDLKSIKETWNQAWIEIKSTDRRLLITCIFEKCIASFGCTTILTLVPPYVAATFNADKRSQNFYLIIFQMTSGTCALVTAALFALVKPLSRLNSARVFVFALVLFAVAYSLSIPMFDFYSHPVTIANAANPFGCNVTEFAWCEGARIVDTPVWIGGTGAVLGVAFLTANIAHDTMYSQILGKIDQNVLTGLLILVVDISMIAVPLLATTVFSTFGPSTWWCIVVTAMLGGLIIWIATLSRFDEYRREITRRDEETEMEEASRKITEESTIEMFPTYIDAALQEKKRVN